MKKIKLTQGKYALVDNEDYDDLMRWKWHAAKCNKGDFYARRAVTISFKKTRQLPMHRYIMRAGNNSKRKLVDHKDGNTLNNQKSNLRICNKTQNCQNRIPKRNGNCKYLGVCFHKRDNIYQANIRIDTKLKYLGSFTNAIKAARAYDEAAKKYHGEFARLNFKK